MKKIHIAHKAKRSTMTEKLEIPPETFHSIMTKKRTLSLLSESHGGLSSRTTTRRTRRFHTAVVQSWCFFLVLCSKCWSPLSSRDSGWKTDFNLLAKPWMVEAWTTTTTTRAAHRSKFASRQPPPPPFFSRPDQRPFHRLYGSKDDTDPSFIERVAIVGAGIAGLSMAHCLVDAPGLQQRYSTTSNLFDPQNVSVFDARSTIETTGAGAGVQLNGGLAVLGNINPRVQRAVQDAGVPQVAVQSRTQSWTRRGDFDALFQLDLKQAVQRQGAADTLFLRGDGTTASSSSNEEGPLLWTAIMRGALQQALLDTLPDSFVKENVHLGKRLEDMYYVEDTTDDTISDHKGKGGAMLVFADGTSAGPFDLGKSCTCFAYSYGAL